MQPVLPKFVITGPESSGKTTLARELAQALSTCWVPEFARPFLSQLGRPYLHADLSTIAAGQAAWEDWYAMHLLPPQAALICDTDWTVIRVWDRYGFAQEPALTLPRPARPPMAYLLCSPDMPWQPDPLREHPEEREHLFEVYERLLQAARLPYIVMEGDEEQRLRTALAAVCGFL